MLSKEGDHRFPASATRRLASWVWKFSSVVTGLEWCLHEAVRVNNKPSKMVVFISLCIMGISLLPTQKYDKKVICGKKAVRVLLQVSILSHRTSFLTHIYQIYFQMIGYNGSVISDNVSLLSVYIKSLRILLFIHSIFYEGANYLIIFLLNPSFPLY